MLALAVGLTLGQDVVQRLVLVNPATSYTRTPWRQLGPLLTQLPKEAYSALPLALAPVISNPLALAAFGASFRPGTPADLLQQLARFAQGLLSLLPNLQALADILPPATLAHKLELLQQGCEWINPRIGQVPQRSLALFSDADLMIPSLEEARRYRRVLPRARVKVFGGRGHALLQEAGVDLLEEISLAGGRRRGHIAWPALPLTSRATAGFYTDRRVLSSDPGWRPKRHRAGRPASEHHPQQGQEAVSGDGGEAQASRLRAEAAATAVSGSSGLEQQGAYSGQGTMVSVDMEPGPAPSPVALATAASATVTAARRAAAAAQPMATSSSSSSSSSRAKAARSPDSRGRAQRVDLPTRREVELQSEGLVSVLRRLVSPVWISTDLEGRRQLGLGALPLDRRPVLFVGNHTTFAPDLGLLVTELLLERGTLIRGLAHPAIFQPGAFGSGDRDRERQQESEGPESMQNLFAQYGAVRVSGSNFYRLLEMGENVRAGPHLPTPAPCAGPGRSVRAVQVLLFPGGVREAYRRKGEAYQLFWPEQQEFVGMASRFGATIVPFASVGADDSVEILADGPELLRAPILGDRLRQGLERVPRARQGASLDRYGSFGDEQFVAPLIAPKVPQRYYFLFGRPVQLSGGESKAELQQVYEQVRDEVEGSITWLLKRRLEDPYGDFLRRTAYEAVTGGQAPTFRI